MRAPPPQDKPAAPDAYGQQGGYEQDPYASNQGGYQPDYNQQGYNQVINLPATYSQLTLTRKSVIDCDWLSLANWIKV